MGTTSVGADGGYERGPVPVLLVGLDRPTRSGIELVLARASHGRFEPAALATTARLAVVDLDRPDAEAERRRLAGLPVVGITIDRSRRIAGVAAVVHKPLQAAALVAALDRALAAGAATGDPTGDGRTNAPDGFAPTVTAPADPADRFEAAIARAERAAAERRPPTLAGEAPTGRVSHDLAALRGSTGPHAPRPTAPAGTERELRAGDDHGAHRLLPRSAQGGRVRAESLQADDGTGHVSWLLGQAHDEEPVPDLTRVDLTDPHAVARVSYDPDRHLDGAVRAAVARSSREGRPVELRGPWGALLVDAAEHLAVVDVGEWTLRATCHRELGPLEVRTVRRGAARDRLDEAVGLDSLRWDVAIWSSNGRLPCTVDPTRALALRVWPDLPRLRLTPHALPLAGAMVSAPVTITEAAHRFGIPQSHVFAFVAGADALGLLGETGATVRRLPAKDGDRGVVRRLLHRLRAA